MTGIRLGLRRISKLVENIKTPWKAIHIAGTNGKGSVCNYTYGILRASGLKCGMFTSPHLIDRWDSISLNGRTIDKNFFHRIEERVKSRNEELQIDASPFELLTATAFEAFTESKVDVAVIETGVGGSEDATNIIEKPLACIVTQLGLDHEDLLGKGMENIVKHKSGIFKHKSACIIDGTNSPDVVQMLERRAKFVGADPITICTSEDDLRTVRFRRIPGWRDMPEYKRMHWALAFEAARTTLRAFGKTPLDWQTAVLSAAETPLPGRQQFISIEALTGRHEKVLLDGCHNEESAKALSLTVASEYRRDSTASNPVCWILAASSGKDIHGILKHLIRDGDAVVITEFGPVDGMPWITPMPAADIASTASSLTKSCTTTTSVLEALKKATEITQGRSMVIAGSLYLVSDVLRLLRDANISTKALKG